MSHIPASAMPHAKPHEDSEEPTAPPSAPVEAIEPEAPADAAPTEIGPEDIVPAASSEPESPVKPEAEARGGSTGSLLAIAIGLLAVGGIAAALTLRGSDKPGKGDKRKAKRRQGKAADAD